MSTVKNSIRSIYKSLFYRPRGIRLGANSYILRPHRLSRSSRINIGDRTLILDNAIINPISFRDGVSYDPTIIIGDDVYIGSFAFLAATRGVEIGSGSVLSDYVYVNDSLHGVDPKGGPIMTQPLTSKGPIKIGKNCFLGLRSAVMPGVTLGDHCVVGVNSVVTNSFPGFCMIAGAPARLVRVYSHAKGQWVNPSDESLP